jgi:hypothetical protein
MSGHTPGVMKAVTVIMNGKLAIGTEYGRKSAEGIADLIDYKTGVGKLLEACKAALDCMEKAGMGDYTTADFIRHTIRTSEGVEL